MKAKEWSEYRALRDSGWQVQKHNQVRLNGGSESKDHLLAKSMVAHAGKEAGYKVSSEVEHDRRGEIDILLYGNDGRLTLAVECETNPTDDVMADKRQRYVDGTPIDEMFVISVDELPANIDHAYNKIKEKIGL